MSPCCLPSAGSLPLAAQTATRLPLTGAAVAAALAGNGLRVDASQVELPATLSTSSGDPQLHVTGAELLPDGRLRVRLACRRTGECQPFLATLRSASAPETMANLINLQKQLQPSGSAPKSGMADRLLAGQRVTLLLEDAHMRIVVPVLAIDSGIPGAEVRVSSLDRKQIYRATVADAGTVRGMLP